MKPAVKRGTRTYISRGVDAPWLLFGFVGAASKESDATDAPSVKIDPSGAAVAVDNWVSVVQLHGRIYLGITAGGFKGPLHAKIYSAVLSL